MTPSFRTIPDLQGECETCGRTFFARNAIGLAAQHADRNPDHYIRVERTVVYVWEGGRT